MLASLFLIWGFLSTLNNTLLPHLRSVFDLNYRQTTLIESVWFIAYFFAAIPSAKLIERIGYKKSLVWGLLAMAFGALLILPASTIPSYGMVLVALFIIASGITLLQVAANPYVAVIGSPATSSSRLNLVQAFNSMGTTIAPLFGGYLILGRSLSGTAEAGTVLTQAERLADAQSSSSTYHHRSDPARAARRHRFVAARHQRRHRRVAENTRPFALAAPNLVFGVPAIFIYLIAEDRRRQPVHQLRV